MIQVLEQEMIFLETIKTKMKIPTSSLILTLILLLILELIQILPKLLTKTRMHQLKVRMQLS